MRLIPLLHHISHRNQATRGPSNKEDGVGTVAAPSSHLVSIDGAELVGPGYIMRDGAPIYEADGEGLFTGYVKRWTEDGRAYLNRGKDKPANLFARADGLSAILVDAVYTFVHYNMIYGHFLLEMMPKLLLIKDLIERGYRHPVAMPASAPDWMRRHVAEILPDAEILHFDDSTQKIVGRVLAISGDFLFMHPWVVGKYSAFAGHQEQRRKVFLVRPDGHYSRRIFVTEQHFADIARDRGYEIIEPSGMTFREQAALFASCIVIAGEFTSALHNTLFSPKGTAVIGINRVSEIQWRIASARGHYLDYITPETGAIDWAEQVRFTADAAMLGPALDAAESWVLAVGRTYI